MKYLIVGTFGIFITACSTSQSKLVETSECGSYRAMMTAPMPPNEILKLKDKCEQSLKK